MLWLEGIEITPDVFGKLPAEALLPLLACESRVLLERCNADDGGDDDNDDGGELLLIAVFVLAELPLTLRLFGDFAFVSRDLKFNLLPLPLLLFVDVLSF